MRGRSTLGFRAQGRKCSAYCPVVGDVKALKVRLQGGMFSIPCTTDTVITLTFGQAAFQIDPRDMLFQPMTNNLMGQCISSLSAGNIVDDQTWLLGGESMSTAHRHMPSQ